MKPPYAFQIELVEGCNRYCDFCGIRSIRKKPKEDLKFAELDTLGCIARNIKRWSDKFNTKRRLEFAMHGEPTLHPKLIIVLRMFREITKTQLMLTTNGDGLTSEYIQRMFMAGLNILYVNNYQRGLYEKRKVEYRQIGIEIKDYADLNPHRFISAKAKLIILAKPLPELHTQTKAIHLAAGNMALDKREKYGLNKVELPLKKSCTKPFREMSITYDGTVLICCEDWRHQNPVGSIHNEMLERVWTSEKLTTVRKALRNKLRVSYPCNQCSDNGGFRKGLLPKLPKPTNDDIIKIQPLPP